MTSSGESRLNIRTNASPKWDRTRCPFKLYKGSTKMIQENDTRIYTNLGRPDGETLVEKQKQRNSGVVNLV